MNDRDQTKVYAVKLKPNLQETTQPIKELVQKHKKNILKVRRGKNKDKGALLINL